MKLCHFTNLVLYIGVHNMCQGLGEETRESLSIVEGLSTKGGRGGQLARTGELSAPGAGKRPGNQHQETQGLLWKT